MLKKTLCLCLFVHVTCRCLRNSDEGVVFLELELQVIVSRLVMWVLRTSLRSCGIAGVPNLRSRLSDLHLCE